MNKIVKIYIILSLAFLSCNYLEVIKHLDDIKKDSQKQIDLHKDFIKTLSFVGTISDKIYNSRGELNKYQLVININEKFPKKILFEDEMFNPYYFFNPNGQLNISVSERLYEVSKINIRIGKKSGSENLIIDNKEYLLLDKSKYKWIPNP